MTRASTVGSSEKLIAKGCTILTTARKKFGLLLSESALLIDLEALQCQLPIIFSLSQPPHMEAPDTPNHVLQRLAAGDSVAQFKVFQTYYRRLVGLVDANVADRLTRRIDGSDVALSAMNSLFQRVECGKLKPGSYQELWRILASITMNKLRSHVRYHTAQRRSVDAEAPDALGESASRDAFPEDLTILRDELRASIEALKPYHRSIAIDVLAGEETAEIAERAGRSIRTVVRVERQLEGLLRARLTDLSAS